MKELSPEDVYRGLLGHGLFADKLPPLFSSEQFMAYMYKKWERDVEVQQGLRSEWISFSYIRNSNRKREFGIPNPFSYENLVRFIANNWDNINSVLDDNTAEQAYRVSRIHVRRRSGTQSIFRMNYKDWSFENDPSQELAIGNRYVVKCDISRCFPSIYTHALDWAISGKAAAKRTREGWAHELDACVRKTTNDETQGLLVGPHSSNILSEIILTRIDKELYSKGYRFVRHIDDYSCYVDSEADANKFIIDLDGVLAEYSLSLNQRKTVVKMLPSCSEDDWVVRLRNSAPTDDLLGKNTVSDYLDIAVAAMGESGNTSTISYAFSVLSGRKLGHKAREYYFDRSLHLAYAKPYLLPCLEKNVLIPSSTTCSFTSKLAFFSEALFKKAICERDYLSAAFALYYAIKYDFDICGIDGSLVEPLLKSDDDVLLTAALVFARFKNLPKLETGLLGKAKEFIEGFVDCGSHWLFCYEALPREVIPGKPDTKNGRHWSQCWREIKKRNITFIGKEYVAS